MDLNILKTKIVGESLELNTLLKNMYRDYEDMYKECLLELSAARTAAGGSTAGLEEFYSLVMVVKGNRNLVSSMVRGLKGLRPMDKFSFIEEDIAAAKPEKKPKAEGSIVVPQRIDELTIPEHAAAIPEKAEEPNG